MSSYGAIRTPPASRPRHLPRNVTTPPSIASSSSSGHDGAEYFPQSPRRDSATAAGLYKRARRGKSPHDILNFGGEGVISSDERSGQFGDMPIEDEDIKKLPRKVCTLRSFPSSSLS